MLKIVYWSNRKIESLDCKLNCTSVPSATFISRLFVHTIVLETRQILKANYTICKGRGFAIARITCRNSLAVKMYNTRVRKYVLSRKIEIANLWEHALLVGSLPLLSQPTRRGSAHVVCSPIETNPSIIAHTIARSVSYRLVSRAHKHASFSYLKCIKWCALIYKRIASSSATT